MDPFCVAVHSSEQSKGEYGSVFWTHYHINHPSFTTLPRLPYSDETLESPRFDVIIGESQVEGLIYGEAIK